MITLNIVPQELKNEIQFNGIYGSIKNFMQTLTIVLILFAVSLLVIKLVMQEKLVATVNETAVIVKNTENFSSRARDINNRVGMIEKIQGDAVSWSYLVELLAKKLNDDISFSRVILNKNAASITIFGHADSRDGLLSFKQMLEETPALSDINLPIRNILEKNDINFEISAKIDDYDFKKLE